MLVILAVVVAKVRIQAVDASPFGGLYDAASSQKALYSSADMSFSSYTITDCKRPMLTNIHAPLCVLTSEGSASLILQSQPVIVQQIGGGHTQRRSRHVRPGLGMWERHVPFSSGDLLRSEGSLLSLLLISSIVPDTGEYYRVQWPRGMH